MGSPFERQFVKSCRQHLPGTRIGVLQKILALLPWCRDHTRAAGVASNKALDAARAQILLLLDL